MSNSITERPNGQPAASNGHHAPRTEHSANEIRAACQCEKPSCECQRPNGNVHCPAHNDGAPSLSLTEQNGKTLWKCHTGCTQEAVTKAIKGIFANGISTSHSAAPLTAAKKSARFDWNSATKYDYTDEQGTLLFQVARQGNGSAKQISQRRPDGRGGWVYSLGDTRRVIYHLPEVLAARVVIVCEGEKAADAIRKALDDAELLGEFAATTNPHGAGKWLDEYSAALAEKVVYITPDNDDPGRDHAQKAAHSTSTQAERVSLFELPGLPNKGDAADFFQNGGHIGELLEIAEAAPKWTVNDEQPSEEAQPKRRFTFFSAAQLKARQAPAALIDGVIFENTLAEIAGGHASFKSFVALDMAACVASGIQWQGRDTRRAKVLYIAAEGAAGLKQRVAAWELRHGQEMEVLFLPESVQMHRPEQIEALVWELGQMEEKPGLIVADTLARCFVGGDENSARDAGTFIDGLDALRKATGATILTLHHVGKNGDTRGSTAFSGAFDTIIEAKRENTTVTLRCLKQKDAAEFEPLSLVRRVQELKETDEHERPLTSLIFEATDAPAIEIPKADQTREQVFQALKNAVKGLSASDWQKASEEQSGIKASRFYDHRDALVKASRVTREGRVYKTTPITPITPNRSQSEPKSYSDYSDDSLESEQSELAGVKNGVKPPNNYGND
jgi:hypothetical protein